MATLTIDNFPDALNERLSAAARRRGLTPAQLIIEQMDEGLPRLPQVTEQELMAEIDDIRRGFIGPAFTPDELEAAIAEGRE